MPPPAGWLTVGRKDTARRRRAEGWRDYRPGFRPHLRRAYFSGPRHIGTCWRLFMSRLFTAARLCAASAFVTTLLLLSLPGALSAQQDSASTASDRWDVARSFGPTQTIRFETDEATWVNVTVSPDGGTVVFDVLGDLYAMPIAGGEARRITSGLAYDMQPRYSPDGRTIAYISDAGGAHNVWLMDADFTN